MPLFIAEEELHKIGGDVEAVVAKADAFAKDLLVQIETHKARADAAVINAEQTCAFLEQKYVALMAQVTQLEGEKSHLALSLDAKSSELAKSQAQIHQLELQLMKRDGDLESQSFEIKELHKARKEMLDVIEKKNLELDEKNAASRQYLEKVLALTDEKSNLESTIHEQTAELTRLRAHEARIVQEKDIISQHNNWLNQELSTKVSNLLEERQRNAQAEAELQAKVLEAERTAKEKDEALNRSQERVKDLESELHGLIEELRFLKEDAASKEEHLSTEVATASKLAELYKKSSEEWSKKATELEGVIKALELHLNKCKDEYEERIKKEVEAREALEKELASVKENYEKKLLEYSQQARDPNAFQHYQLAIRTSDDASELHDNAVALPKFPYGLSGTAIAATLLRDGWSLGTVYAKYQEAVDAWRHEKNERNRAQALLNRVLEEVEDKTTAILEERADFRRMVKSYGIMEEKLRLSISDQSTLENSVKDLKAELRKKDRELKSALKDVSDLQTQVSVLVKECLDIQKRHGIGDDAPMSEDLPLVPSVPDMSSSDAIISDKLLTFKDIHGLVEHNTQLRSLVRMLAEQNERKEQEMKEEFDAQLKARIDEASEKVKAVLRRAEEQNNIIESLQGTVGMYKRLYEEERSIRSTYAVTPGVTGSDDGRDLRRLLDISQEDFRRQLDEAHEQTKALEGELAKARQNISSARADTARAEAEAAFAKEKLASLVRESENQRRQMESMVQRNMELSQTVTDFQRKLRESLQNVQSAEEQARRLSIEVSVLEREKELLINAEKRAAEEASQLSDRVHRLQATLDTIETTVEVREVSKAAERKKLEEDVNRMQREWVEAKHELELERNHARNVTSEREKAMERVEALSTELKGALAALSASELRTKVFEARCVELEASLKRADEKIMSIISGGKRTSISEDTENEVLSTLQQARQEIELLKEELSASMAHAEQYKHIAQANEEALKKMEEAHSRFKEEAAKTTDIMDSELKLLQKHLSDVESHSLEKEKEAGATRANRETELRNALKQIALLEESDASKRAALERAEERIKVLKEDLEKQHQRWRQAQNNYERQVMLQADTIRELTLANEKLASLEQQEKIFRETAGKAESELESVKVTFYMEKASLEAGKLHLENRLKELDEQNRLLLDRLEAKHIAVAEQDRHASTSGGISEEGSELQNVIQYLRRAKEAADTEISLLKQERTRLNKQFEAASRVAEEAQAKLRQHHDNLRASIYTDEEFRALQAQVMEMNLLREHNVQLREDNKRTLEENQELRERLCKVEEETESLKRSLREKHVELEASANEINSLKAEISRWQQRVSQMIEKYKALDVEDYERVKRLLVQNEVRLKEMDSELEYARKDALECRENMVKYQQEAAMKAESISELERKLQEAQSAEVAARSESERSRRLMSTHKRKIETLTKELEELKSGKKEQESSDAQKENFARFEQAQRESEKRIQENTARIHLLESALKSEKDSLQREKFGRARERKQLSEFVDRAKVEKQRVLEQIETLREEFRQAGASIPTEDLDTSVKNYEVLLDQISDFAFKPPAEAENNLQNISQNVTPASSAAQTSDIVGATTTPPLPPAVQTTTSVVQPITGATTTPPLPPAVQTTTSVVQPITVASKPPQPPALSNKEREMQELRATIVEKERYHLRRPGRRLVRPRIEPSSQNQPDSTVEQPEPSAVMETGREGIVTEAPGENATTGAITAVAMDVTTTVIATHKRSLSETIEEDTPQKKARNEEQSAVDVATHMETNEDDSRLVTDEDKTTEKRVRFVRSSDNDSDTKTREKSPELPQTRDGNSEDILPEDVFTLYTDMAETAMEPAGAPTEPQPENAEIVQGDQTDAGGADAEIVRPNESEETSDFPVDVEDGEISLGTAEEPIQEAGGEQENVQDEDEAGDFSRNKQSEPVKSEGVEPSPVIQEPAAEGTMEPEKPATSEKPTPAVSPAPSSTGTTPEPEARPAGRIISTTKKSNRAASSAETPTTRGRGRGRGRRGRGNS